MIPSKLKALLLAGLSFFGGQCLAAELSPAPDSIPARKVGPLVLPPASVRPEELEEAEKRLKQSVAEAVRKSEDAHLAMRKSLELLNQELDELGRKWDRTAKFQGDHQVLMDRQAKEVGAFNELLGALKLDVAQTLKKAEQARADVERKGEKLEGLLDLVSTLKRDLNDNSHEIVELQAALAKVKARQGVPEDEPEWWAKILRWRYLPATAAALSVIAVGVAVTK